MPFHFLKINPNLNRFSSKYFHLTQKDLHLGLPHLHFLMLICHLLLRYLLLEPSDLLCQFLPFVWYFLDRFIFIDLNYLVSRTSHFWLVIGLKRKKKVHFLFWWLQTFNQLDLWLLVQLEELLLLKIQSKFKLVNLSKW